MKVKIPKGWRILKHGEKIRKTDMWWGQVTKVWKKFSEHAVGCVGEVSAGNYDTPNIRRKSRKVKGGKK